MGYHFHSSATAEMRVPSIFALIGTTAVILTYVLFPRLRSLRYVQIVFYIGVNDLIASIGTAMGSKTNSAECWYQGIATNYNYLVAIFWTNVIAYQMYSIVVKNEESAKSLAPYHLICWIFPLIVTLLPLTTNTYGEADDQSGWCFIANRPDSPRYGELMWIILSFYIWVWASIAFILCIFVRTGVHLYHLTPVPPAVYNVYWKLGLYPLALIICWIPCSVDDMLAEMYDSYSFPGSSTLNLMANMLPPLQGFLLSVIFFGSNPVIRQLWFNCWFCKDTMGKPTREQIERNTELHTNLRPSSTCASLKFSEATDFGISASLVSWDMNRTSSFGGSTSHRFDVEGSEYSAEGSRC
jgi:hypothetical protein